MSAKRPPGMIPAEAEPTPFSWPPEVVSGPGPESPKVGLHQTVKWQTPNFIPTLQLIEWPLLADYRDQHATALAALENACGRDPASADQDAIREALRELRRVSQEAVYALQAEGAAAPAFEDYARHRERLQPPAAGPAYGMAPVALSRENEGAAKHNARVDAFFHQHREERAKLKADHAALSDVLGPSFAVVDDAETIRLLAEPEPELPGGNRGEGEAAQSFAEQEAEAA